ncbi:MAG TPA: D-aminoacyl-tRNA deacylase [Methanothermococcus okinawensis]|uniref:D-aminoacyl-tRNA deacylase n=1 Tax=Methanothermococcus okinawensis TaxID=155863 RepID=A0A832ZCU3_9EURY|nr:D-aminoacyl-tRNA deacylase [Methanothermococcus okinawensis]HIP91235.1 D-aminoacyl-tRNA deacylase [Methanothermococcus okinawensis]
MRYLLIYSTRDPAGLNIKENLDNVLEGSIRKHISYFETEEDLITLSQKDIPKGYDYYIFLSKHRSGGEHPPPTLTVHTPGNLTEDNLFGGNPQEVCPCDSVLNSLLLRAIFRRSREGRYKDINFQVSFEAVHHGPSDLLAPSVFVEIGSTEREWRKREGGEIVGRAVLDTIEQLNSKDYNPLDRVIAFGGGHYAPKFTKLVLENRCYVGYIVPKYAKVSDKVLNQLVEKQLFDYVLLDWKGLRGEDKKRYIKFFEDRGIPWKRV